MSTVLKGLLDDYVPADLGFDNEQFPEYRDVQLEAIEFAAYSEKRFVGLGMPTGSGKSLCAASLHKLTGLRTAILTSTKGLQATYLDKHERDGLVDIRGRDNYECRDKSVIEAHGEVSCRKGNQLGCSECGLCDGSYLSARDRARDAELISTNYDWWFHANEHGRGAERSGEELEINGENPIQLLILDEADASISRLSNYLNVKVRENELEGEYESESIGETLKKWQKIAAEQLVQIDKQQRTLKMEIEYLMKAKRLKDVLEVSERIEKLDERIKKYKRISGMVEKEWVIEKHEHFKYGTSWSFDVVWPGRYAEKHLFVGVEKVVLMSATLRPKHLRMLGIGADVSEFREWRRVFKPERGPILHLPPMKVNEKGEPVMININRHIKDEDLNVWVELIDEVIEEWAVKGKHKGLIHTKCVEPKTRLLTADLRWKPIEEISIGEDLLAFDEFPKKRGHGGHRCWRRSTVEDHGYVMKPSVRVILEDGTSIVCSKDHLWLTQSGASFNWVQAKYLRFSSKVSSCLVKLIDPWDDVKDWRTGYLSAAYDGEGCLYQKKYGSRSINARSLRLSFSQKDNLMMATMKKFLTELGFEWKYWSYPDNPNRKADCLDMGQKAQIMRMLGYARPQRLLDKLNVDDLGKMASRQAVRVVELEDVGMKKLVWLKTSTRTFIAEGFASHNSYERQKYILENSKHSNLMIGNTSDPDSPSAWEAFEKHCTRTGPSVLVSPSFSTGWDFEGDKARWQIIAKVPFVPRVGKLMQARLNQDSQYADQLTMTELMQSAGRVVRGEDDWAVTLIVDGALTYFMTRNKHLAPGWFGQAIRRVGEVPKARKLV